MLASARPWLSINKDARTQPRPIPKSKLRRGLCNYENDSGDTLLSTFGHSFGHAKNRHEYE